MHPNKILALLLTSVFFLCSFSPARVPTRGDIFFGNNTNQLVSAGIFQTSLETKIITNIPAGGSYTHTIDFESVNDNFNYIITFPSPTPQEYTVTTRMYLQTTVQTIPAGVTAFTYSIPIPGAVGGIVVNLDIK